MPVEKQPKDYPKFELSSSGSIQPDENGLDTQAQPGLEAVTELLKLERGDF
jgi:hypothetical protein